MLTNLFSRSNYLPAVSLPSVLTRIATAPVLDLASFIVLWFDSIDSTTPSLRCYFYIYILIYNYSTSWSYMQIGVLGFKIPYNTSTPNIIGSFLLKN